MVDKERLQELTKNLFSTCEVFDTIFHSGLFSFKRTFISDIDSFLLVFSSNPFAQLEKTEWLPEIYSRQNKKVKSIFQEISEINCDLSDTEPEIPMLFQKLKQRMHTAARWKNLLLDAMEDFYEFFDLFGHWILEESDKNASYEKRRIILEETLELIRNSIDN